jgi:hypothetical protein
LGLGTLAWLVGFIIASKVARFAVQARDEVEALITGEE